MNITLGAIDLATILFFLSPLILPGVFKAIALGYLIGATHVKIRGENFEFSKKKAIITSIALLVFGLAITFLCIAYVYSPTPTPTPNLKVSPFSAWPLVMMGYSLVVPMGYYYCLERYEDVAWERVTIAILVIIGMDLASMFIEKYLYGFAT